MGLYARCIEREVFGPSGTPAPTAGALGPAPADHFRDVTKMVDVDEATCATLGEALAALEDPEALLDPEPEPEPDEPMKPGLILDPPPIYPEQPSPLDGPVELRAKDIKRELSTTPKFSGPNAKLKRETYDRMAQFRLQHGLGSYQTVSDATGGICTEWQLRDMMDNKPAPQSRWDALKKALDKLEGGK